MICFFICTFEKGEYYIDLAGGYNENSFTWTIKDNPYAINDYLIAKTIREKIITDEEVFKEFCTKYDKTFL